MQHTLQKGFILEGKYEIVEVLGEGAFGITYKAYDKLLDRYVVIKEYMPESFAIRENTRVSIKSLKDKDLFEWGLIHQHFCWTKVQLPYWVRDFSPVFMTSFEMLGISRF